MGVFKILVADDDPDILEVISVVLEDLGYEVTTTLQPGFIPEKLVDIPDLFLLDVWMSGEHGGDICRKIKAMDKLKHIPVILISANENLKEVCSDCGADDFIEKPFKIKDLIHMVAKYLSSDLQNQA